jgi:uncharacterized protein (TIGR03435 family)
MLNGKHLLATARVGALAVSVVASALTMTGPRPGAQAPTASAAAPQWEIDAGGKMAFDVASVKQNKSNDQASSSFPLGPGDAYSLNGGFFSATNQPLIAYLRFAYKLGQGDLLTLPAWVYNDRFDIAARAEGNPTKDQMRLMMQSLLGDRFKASVHTEGRQGPVYALVLSKAGKVGPQLQPHVDDKSCSAVPTQQTPGTAQPAATLAPSSTSGLQLPQIACGSIGQLPASLPDRGRIGGRGVILGRIAGFLKNPFTGIDRPVFDRTGLTGTFDFSLEWSMASGSALLTSEPEDAEPTFLQALQDQLGLKLEAQTGPVDVLVIDHVEEPTPN